MRQFPIRCLLFCLALLVFTPAQAQTITTSNVIIDWKVVNRFRLFRDPAMFKAHDIAWQQYLIHTRNLALPADEEAKLIAQTSVIGTEHVLNDRFIPYTRHLRSNYDWRGWAARMKDGLCWEEKEQGHSACGGDEAYVNPKAHSIEVRLRPVHSNVLISEFNCEWRLDGAAPVSAPCDEPAELSIPFPAGGVVSVNVVGEEPISRLVKVKDLLIVGLGDSFASGEGNPDVPVTLSADSRFRSQYPGRTSKDGSGNAQWTDEKCHRSLYSYQLRAALQIAIETPQAAVTFLGYACSGASVEEGLLGPQTYVGYESRSTEDSVAARPISGGRRDTQIYRLLADLCQVKPEMNDGLWQCPDKQFRRSVDYLLLSVGGNDIGFSNLVAWATLRDSASAKLAKFFGATVSAKQFATNMKSILPEAYARLAKVMETTLPVTSGDLPFDSSRIFLSAYPDILSDEQDKVCAAGDDGVDETQYPSNQSLDKFSSWLVVTSKRLNGAHEQLTQLYGRMRDLSEDHGWSFAGRVYADRAFRGRGFCALNRSRLDDPAEMLRIPCWSKPNVDAQSCERSFTAGDRIWQPYHPVREHFPYALRQRWVRTFNDVYMIVNQKVLTADGRIDDRASDAVFAETTGAMHPSAEGHAAMADALLIDLRARVREHLESK